MMRTTTITSTRVKARNFLLVVRLNSIGTHEGVRLTLVNVRMLNESSLAIFAVKDEQGQRYLRGVG
jgi:hypothetical protein